MELNLSCHRFTVTPDPDMNYTRTHTCPASFCSSIQGLMSVPLNTAGETFPVKGIHIHLF
uniref:Uncharacterized protein n=1 Tax=Anguilla anguilla TaxID=7936 RepID=A0A0E9W729_ANGAN